MTFSSPVFLFLFLPAVLVGHRMLHRRHSLSMWWLVLASLVFYFAWKPHWLPLLMGSTAINYLLGCELSRRPRGWLLGFGITLNLTPLAIAKYAGWLTGLPYLTALVLPLGISFWTFQQIAYLVDAFKGRSSESTFRDYALFVVFFPQLVAGPIVHHKEMLAQFSRPSTPVPDKTLRGLLLLALGLFKKVVIADNLAPLVDPVFGGTGVVSLYEAWTAAVAYTLQLYFDFSGYCEMAMGIALLFGVTLPVNFRAPYSSRSISEFWRRWHITLGRFFRDYLYIPLGGNQAGVARMYIALLVVAMLSGLWHGAGLTFLVWGSLHGIALVVHKATSRAGLRLPDPVSLLTMVLFLVLSWVVFRASTLDVAVEIWRSMFGLNGWVSPPLIAQLGGESTQPVLNTVTGLELPLLAVLLWFCTRRQTVHDMEFSPSLRLALSYSAAVLLSLFSITNVSDFLYWSF